MLLLATIALATPLDLATSDALALIDACGHANAAACVTLAASAERAAAASVVDHAWGNDEIAVYRLQQASVYLAAACDAGASAACRTVVERTDACMGELDCGSALNDTLQGTLESQCRFGSEGGAADTRSAACARLEKLGWRGVVGDVLLHGSLDPIPVSTEAPTLPTPAVDAAGRTYRFRQVRRLGSGWLGFADRALEAPGQEPQGATRVLAWQGSEPGRGPAAGAPSTSNLPQTLLAVPFSTSSVVQADGDFIAWSVNDQVSRARLVQDAAGLVTLTDVKTLAATGRTRAYPVPIESLSLAHDGAALFVADGEAWVWGGSQPMKLGDGQEVSAVPSGAVLVARAPGGATALHVYDAHGVDVGVVKLPPDSYLRPGSDGGALVLTSGAGWAEVDIGPGSGPAFGVPATLAAARAGSGTGTPGVQPQWSAAPPVFTDSAGIPLAGLDIGVRDALGDVVLTDVHGIAGVPIGPLGGRDGLASSGLPGATVLLSEGELRARKVAAGPGVTLKPSPPGLYVEAVDPHGLWASRLTVGETFRVQGLPPPEGWTLDRLWAAARAEWPSRGVNILPVDATSGLPNGPLVELPGGLPCSWVTAAYRSLDGYCPSPQEVGGHLRPVPASTWATLDLVAQLAGTWDAIDPARDRRERVRARVEALYADPGSPALEGVDPSEETEAVALASLLSRQADPADILNVWFKIPKEPVPPVVIGTRGRDLVWNGRRVAAAAFADEVRIPGAGRCDWLFFADPDTFVYCGDVYVRRR